MSNPVPHKEVAILSFPEAESAPQKNDSPKIHLEDPSGIPSIEQTVLTQSTPAEKKVAPDDDIEVARVQEPYEFPPLSDDVLNTTARASLVNILCILENGQSVSGSGVMINSRGIVLTNAHVGQYVLLSEVSKDINCFGRKGSPAKDTWKLRVLFMPRQWIEEHAKDLRSPKPTGTGEHDYALLFVEPLDPQTILTSLPYAEYDAREGISFESDQVMLASYPAGFVGGFIVYNNLYPATTFTQIRELFTFENSTVDLLSLGGVILAQGGSSGGMVINRWGRVVGLIVTTSDGETTAERDLRAITLAHIDRSIYAHTGVDFAEFTNAEVDARANFFRTTELPALAQQLLNEIPQQ